MRKPTSEVTLATALHHRGATKVTLKLLRGDDPVTVKVRPQPERDTEP